MDALAQFLTQHFPDTKLHLILSCSKDKQYEEMTRLLIPLFHSITFTKFTRNPRAVEPHVLYQSAVTACNNLASRTQTESNPLTAFQQILERANENDLVVVTGSFYLIAELRQQALMLGN